jgi:hypothetical protein
LESGGHEIRSDRYSRRDDNGDRKKGQPVAIDGDEGVGRRFFQNSIIHNIGPVNMIADMVMMNNATMPMSSSIVPSRHPLATVGPRQTAKRKPLGQLQ